MRKPVYEHLKELKLYSNRVVTKDVVADDIDPAEFNDLFVRATSGADKESLIELLKLRGMSHLYANYRRETLAESDAQRRDFMEGGFRRCLDLDDPAALMSVDGDDYRCLRCRTPHGLEKKCDANNRKITPALYTGGDYLGPKHCEEGIVGIIDLVEYARAMNWAPYGDCDPDLEVGERVKICLPNHYYQDAIGFVVVERRKGEYLIKITSKKVPTLDTRTPPPPGTKGFVWVWYDGLSRTQMSLVKGGAA